MPTLLLCSATDDLSDLHTLLRHEAARRMPGLQVRLWPDMPDPADVEAVAGWYPPAGLMGGLPNLRLASSIAAGVDHVLGLAQPRPEVPVCRIVDPGLAAGMAEYVLWAVLYYHRALDQARQQQAQRLWKMPVQKAAHQTHVGLMGLGVLGSHVARVLRAQGFAVSGWSRSAHAIDGVTTYAGPEALNAFLREPDVLVCLLPLTDATRGLLSREFFQAMKRGAALVHCGRGEHLVVEDLLQTLDRRHLRGAVLDVFAEEPLPASSALWAHPRVVVTPHMASGAQPAVIVGQILDNLQRVRSGQPVLNAVDRGVGY
jgi:glyoxylate/hydroxypyruvate reductase A